MNMCQNRNALRNYIMWSCMCALLITKRILSIWICWKRIACFGGEIVTESVIKTIKTTILLIKIGHKFIFCEPVAKTIWFIFIWIVGRLLEVWQKVQNLKNGTSKLKWKTYSTDSHFILFGKFVFIFCFRCRNLYQPVLFPELF